MKYGRHLIVAVILLVAALLLSHPVSAKEKEEGTSAGKHHKIAVKKSGKASTRAGKKQAKSAADGKEAHRVAAQSDSSVAERESAAAHSVLGTVTEIRSWSNPDYSRVAITVDREVRFAANQIKQHRDDAYPSRIYIDLEGSRLGAGVHDLPIGDGFLKTARVGQFKADIVRVVLDVEHIKDYKVFALSDPFRIIVDVKGERPLELTKLTPVLQPAPQRLPEPVAPEIKSKPSQEKPAAPFKPGKIRRVVVDPGHGGHDPGAIGAGGTKEKDVVLAIGLKLAEKLRDELGLDVVMTRSTDVFIPLEERTAIANKVNADLFVSVHANASLNRAASGIETYYLNLAKTEKAAQVAARENNTSLEKVSLLQAILFDLMANYKLNDSAHLADEVQRALNKKMHGSYSGVKNLGVKQGPFYVLVGATMPSILVESAFISNEAEEARLKDPAFQEKTAEGIVEGIRGYIQSLDRNK